MENNFTLIHAVDLTGRIVKIGKCHIVRKSQAMYGKCTKEEEHQNEIRRNNKHQH